MFEKSPASARIRKTDNVTSECRCAGGAILSQAQNGHIIISNAEYMYYVFMFKKYV